MWIDKDTFHAAFQVFDKEVVAEIIELFIGEYSDRMDALDKDINDNDFESLRFNAHSIKGVIANYSAPDLHQMAKELEEKGRDQDSSNLKELFQTFKSGTAEMIEELKVLKEDYL